MVVIAIIGISIAISLPAVQSARESARRVTCANNLHQMGLAMHMYHYLFRVFPAGFNESNQLLWSGAILPQLEQTAIYEKLDFQRSFTSGVNDWAMQTSITLFRCPSAIAPGSMAHGVAARVPATYLACVSGLVARESGPSPVVSDPVLDGMFYRNSTTRFRSLLDGASHTLMLGETLVGYNELGQDATGINQLPDHWAIGSSTLHANELSETLGSTAVAIGNAVSTDPHIYPDEKELSFSSNHSASVHVLYADGRVTLHNESIDRKLWSAAGTVANLDTQVELP